MSVGTTKNCITGKGISKGIVVFFFVMLFLYGCCTFDDYGISSDEPLQRQHSLVMYHDLFMNKEYKTDTVDTSTLPTLAQYGVNYGVILQLPLILVEHLHEFELSYLQIYAIRHLYSFLWFFVSALYFYRLALILSEGNPYHALLGTILYVLGPRTLADSFYNIKDALAMALFTISMYYGVMTIKKMSWKYMFPFVLFSALCTASRIVGGVVVAVCLLVLFCKSIQNGTWKKLLGICTLLGVSFVAAFILITPNAWANIPGTLMKIIQTFSNYTIWDYSVKYFGQWVKGSELPWHYLFVWIAMTVPAVYLIYALFGIGNSVKYCMTNRSRLSEEEDRGWIYMVILLILVIPFLYVIVVRPVLYNGWRHFYFMYSVIAACAVIGIHSLFQMGRAKWIRWGGVVVLMGSFVCAGFWILKNHPYEYIYYNRWIKEYAADNFQRDYWFVTEQEALQYILEHDDSERISVHSYQGYQWIFATMQDERLVQKRSWEEAEYVIADEEAFVEAYLFEKIYTVSADGMDLRNVYRRTYDPFRRISLRLGDQEQSYEQSGMTWTKQTMGSETVYDGYFADTVPTDVIALVVSDPELWGQQIQVYVTGDGEVWHNVREFPAYSQYGDRMSAECSVHDLKGIRIVSGTEHGNEDHVEIILCGYSGNVKEMAVTNPIIKEISSNVVTDTSLQYVLDADGNTRWTTPAQQAGMCVVVELQEAVTLSGIWLELNESVWDHPRNLEVLVSNDNIHWTKLDVKTQDNEMFYTTPVSCRYLKLQLGHTDEAVQSNWSIYELRLFSLIPTK